MPKIKILDEALINKIAAGEVIERPASVVKELVENSIDAGADNIKIELKDGGKSYIRVEDNGYGMEEEDARLSIQRHATSKIKASDDLFNITTLGFRGEALASIAAVSNLKITTKLNKSIEGFFMEVEAGKVLKEQNLGGNKGTKIEISHLFFNTPVRKKYLKDINYELNKIVDIITRYALINEGISFKVIHNDKLIFNSPKARNLLEKIVTIYGKETAKQMIPVNFEGKIRVHGYISKPSLSRSDKKQQSIFINNRYVKNDTITKAVYEGYRSLLFHGRHPIVIFRIRTDPKEIDVNVHPTKRIVKLSKENEVYNNVYEAVKQSLDNYNLIPNVGLKETGAKPIKKYAILKDKQSILVAKEEEKEYGQKKEDNSSLSKEVKKEKARIGPFRAIGQVNKTYILAESPAGLAIIDQHAAQERILYEKFLKHFNDKGIKKQKLIRPSVFELSVVESNILKDNLGIFKKIGFEIEEYGRNSILIRSVPYIFERFDKNLFMDMLSEIGEIRQKAAGKIKEERIIRFACRKAIKAGLELTMKQMEELIENLDKCEMPYTCPHGRPTIINITLAELERKFKRTG